MIQMKNNINHECRIGRAKYPVKGAQKYVSKFVVKCGYKCGTKHIVLNGAYNTISEAMDVYLNLYNKKTPDYRLLCYNI